MKLQESGENYLETILILEEKIGYVRSIDIANALGYSKPSISRAMSILKNAGYVLVDNGGYILLTAKGRQKANEVYERHRLISEYLVITLDIPKEQADADACRIEHIICADTFEKIKVFVKKSRANG